MPDLISIYENAKKTFSLAEPKDQAGLYELTSSLSTLPENELDKTFALAKQKNAPLEFKLVVKLMESRRYAKNVKKSLRIGIVFAMWGEQNRLLPKSKANPNGEDALRIKVEQLKWLTSGTPIEWDLYAVDDGCPYGSGKIAQEIVHSQSLGKKVNVLFLKDAVPTNHGPLKRLNSVDHSRKAGAVILGCMQAIDDGVDAIIYTDADNSVHLGQIGFLIRPFVENGIRVVLGDRKHPQAVLVKQEGRWGIGIKLLRHMQRMVGQAIFSRNILDTQAAFKLYEASLLKQIIAEPTVFDFSFDTDWILAIIGINEPFEKVPFVFIDSFAESASITQGPMTTWESLLMGLVKSVRRHNIPHNEQMAKILDEEIKSSADLELLINHLPPELLNVVAASLGDPAIMSPHAVQAWIQKRRTESKAD